MRQRCLLVLLGCVWAYDASADRARRHWSAVSVSTASKATTNDTRSTRRARHKSRTAQAPTQPIPPLPERKTAKEAAAVGPVPETWTPQEIAAAQARCTQILKKIDAVVVPHPPIKEGKCGAARPHPPAQPRQQAAA